jgi:5-methylcytosine-specific restriction endonuclease McrA
VSKRVLVGVGTRTVTTRREQLKGYAKSRRDYDRRRRLNTDDATTAAYKRQIRYDLCPFCLAAPDPGRVQDVDHIDPLSLGGHDTWENMTAACRRCNRGRRDTPLLMYLLRRRDRC